MTKILKDEKTDRVLAEIEVLNYTPNPVETVLQASGAAYNKDATSRLAVLMGDTFHESPFRHAHFTFRLKLPLYIFRQLQRSEVGRDFVERSLRYTKIQSSEDFFWTKDYEKDYIERSIEIYKSSIELYKEDNGQGLKAEEARRILPQSMFVTTVMTVSLSWLLRLLETRVYNPAAQPNTRKIAMFIIQSISNEVENSNLLYEVFNPYARKYLNTDV